ncbi:prolyl oligopeptidase family serine peptidase, partial [Escherichia coli]|nr:prolyl oligopeptidase family serine peptidase [Escherichia coli]
SFRQSCNSILRCPSISDGRLSYQFSSDGYIRRSVYAYTASKEKALNASPIGHMKGVKPPFLIMHGSKDTLVSPEQSAKLFRMLKKNGDNAEYVLVEGAEHGDKTWYQPIIINRVVEWFTKNLGAPIKTAPQQQNPNANL